MFKNPVPKKTRVRKFHKILVEYQKFDKKANDKILSIRDYK